MKYSDSTYFSGCRFRTTPRFNSYRVKKCQNGVPQVQFHNQCQRDQYKCDHDAVTCFLRNGPQVTEKWTKPECPYCRFVLYESILDKGRYKPEGPVGYAAKGSLVMNSQSQACSTCKRRNWLSFGFQQPKPPLGFRPVYRLSASHCQYQGACYSEGHQLTPLHLPNSNGRLNQLHPMFCYRCVKEYPFRYAEEFEHPLRTYWRFKWLRWAYYNIRQGRCIELPLKNWGTQEFKNED